MLTSKLCFFSVQAKFLALSLEHLPHSACKKTGRDIPHVIAVAFLVTWGMSGSIGLGMLVLTCLTTLLALGGWRAYQARFKWLTRERTRVLELVRRGGAKSKDERVLLIKQAFDLLDEDHSGELEAAEAAIMLRTINPALTKKDAKRRVTDFSTEPMKYDKFMGTAPIGSNPDQQIPTSICLLRVCACCGAQ